MLQPVKCKTAVDVAIENIGSYIANNMRQGDVLPSERELAEKLQISRNITREALQHFRTLGIIESKPKVGAMVTSFCPEDVYAGYKPFLAIQPHTFQDLAHLRLTLELGCAERAVENVTSQDIEKLTELCEKISSIAAEKKSRDDSGENRLNELDIEFHTRIMRLSKNALINSLIPLVTEFFEKQFIRSQTAGIEYKNGYCEHFEMVDALKNGDRERLTGLIRSHLKSYFKSYKVQDKEN